jgi:hypothetical protein
MIMELMHFVYIGNPEYNIGEMSINLGGQELSSLGKVRFGTIVTMRIL